MKKIFLIVILISPLIVVGQSRYHINEIIYDSTSNIVYQKTNMEILNGVVFDKYENGQLKFEKYFINGTQPTGYESGVVKEKSTLYLEWYESGELKKETWIKNGMISKFGYSRDGRTTSKFNQIWAPAN